MTVSYDLTYFKFLGGIVIEDGGNENHHGENHDNHDIAEAPKPEYHLAPPRSPEEKETPANQIIFNSLWTSQNRDKRSSLKKVVGKVSDLRSRFEKSKRVVSGAFAAVGGRGDTASNNNATEHADRRKPKGPPPPQHVMTLAKGWNSGLEPTHNTKSVQVDY